MRYIKRFLLTHPLRGATIYLWSSVCRIGISTHTPLAGCNQINIHDYLGDYHFYSHTPCGVQQEIAKGTEMVIQFLLTHPLRGATNCRLHRDCYMDISTHTPLAGCNLCPAPKPAISAVFLLTHPLRGATWSAYGAIVNLKISTHTPLAGCNIQDIRERDNHLHFYSHTPCGVQRYSAHYRICYDKFLLTHPLRGATVLAWSNSLIISISTHTPLAGCN